MITHTSRLAKKRTTLTGRDSMNSLSTVAQDPLSFLFERHRYNPFVRFLRAAFFYDDEDPRRLAHDRAPTRKALGRGHFHGGSLRF